jgi:Zn-dependent metalloprotease
MLLFSLLSKAQVNQYCKSPDPGIFRSVSPDGWVKFQPNIGLNPNKLFSENGKSFLLTIGYEMRIEKSEMDQAGITHTRYKEYFNNIPIIYGHFIAHGRNGEIQSGNGKIYTAPVIKQKVSINKETSVQIAMTYAGSSRYWWQDSLREANLKRKSGNPSATYYPNPELYFFYNELQSQLILCYRLNIQATDPGKSGAVFLDAESGKVVLWKSFEPSTCDAALVNTVWYNSRTIYTSFASGWDLQDRCTPSVYSVYDYNTPFNDIFHTSNNQWTSSREQSAATVLWSIRETRNIYNSFFGRNGHDNNNGNLDMYFDYIFAGGNKSNASYHYDPVGDDEINIGTGSAVSNIDDYGTLDIMAHEFTHGVTQYTSNLDYEKEPGALNESFSDIFGEFVENRVLGVNDWLIGFDRKNPSNNAPMPLRYFVDPWGQNDTIAGWIFNFNQPNTYQGGTVWFNVNGCSPAGGPTGNDFCGVHTNSGVQNQMFYLLCAGGNGWNNGMTSHAPVNNGYPWSVSGIGIEKAIRIAYHAMRFYLSSNSVYYDARNAWVHAAEDLFGACSFEAIQTGKAWFAVGIGPPVTFGANICGNFGTIPYFFFRTGQINISTTCTVNVLTTGNPVQFTTGDKIILSPGFSSSTGSRFIANVNSDCSFATY